MTRELLQDWESSRWRHWWSGWRRRWSWWWRPLAKKTGRKESCLWFCSMKFYMIMVTFWMKDGKAHGWWKRRENLPLWVLPSFKYAFNCRWKVWNWKCESKSVKVWTWKCGFHHPSNAPSTSTAAGSNLLLRTKSSGRLFLFFRNISTADSAGVKI